AASSAPAAICSMDRRSSSAAAEAWLNPLASSSVAAATRSEIFSVPMPFPALLARAGDGAGWGLECEVAFVERRLFASEPTSFEVLASAIRTSRVRAGLASQNIRTYLVERYHD